MQKMFSVKVIVTEECYANKKSTISGVPIVKTVVAVYDVASFPETHEYSEAEGFCKADLRARGLAHSTSTVGKMIIAGA